MLILVLGCTLLHVEQVRGQRPADFPSVIVSSPRDLERYLSVHIFPPGRRRTELSLLAFEGERLVPALLELAADTAMRRLIRQNALYVLGLMRLSSLVPQLIRIADEGPGSIRLSAENALLAIEPDSALCAYWEQRFRNPRFPSDHREAAWGLGRCGEQWRSVLEALRDSSSIERLRNGAQQGLEALDGYAPRWELFGGPPRADGAYVPSEETLRKIREAICRPQCPVGPISGDYFWRRRGTPEQ